MKIKTLARRQTLFQTDCKRLQIDAISPLITWYDAHTIKVSGSISVRMLMVGLPTFSSAICRYFPLLSRCSTDTDNFPLSFARGHLSVILTTPLLAQVPHFFGSIGWKNHCRPTSSLPDLTLTMKLPEIARRLMPLTINDTSFGLET